MLSVRLSVRVQERGHEAAARGVHVHRHLVISGFVARNHRVVDLLNRFELPV
jgi:hypothetical protein